MKEIKKCLCGCGTIHIYKKDDVTKASIRCSKCSQKYITIDKGILPRNIPARYQNTKTAKRIRFLESHMSDKPKGYNMAQFTSFMTDDEFKIIYGAPKRSERIWAYMPLSNPRAQKLYLFFATMNSIVYRFTREDIEYFLSCLNMDEYYVPRTRNFLNDYPKWKPIELRNMLERILQDYDKHMAILQQWQDRMTEWKQELEELRTILDEEHKRVDDLQHQHLIPWDALEDCRQ